MADSTLTWNIHIYKISKTIPRATGLLYKILGFCYLQKRLRFYYSLVYPHLNYVTELWGSADPTYLNRILIVQKRIVRMLTFNDFTLKTGKFIYKCLNKKNPINFRDWFILTTEIHNRS